MTHRVEDGMYQADDLNGVINIKPEVLALPESAFVQALRVELAALERDLMQEYHKIARRKLCHA